MEEIIQSLKGANQELDRLAQTDPERLLSEEIESYIKDLEEAHRSTGLMDSDLIEAKALYFSLLHALERLDALRAPETPHFKEY